MEKPQGMSIIQILVIVLVLFGVGAGVVFFLNQERAKTRDAVRMADMARLSAAFFELYATEGSYSSAATGCSAVGAPVSTCSLGRFLPDIATFKDPKGSAYVVAGVPGAASYVITFSLEKSYGVFAAGPHSLTPAGIE